MSAMGPGMLYPIYVHRSNDRRRISGSHQKPIEKNQGISDIALLNYKTRRGQISMELFPLRFIIDKPGTVFTTKMPS